jgi:hypothetical protein
MTPTEGAPMRTYRANKEPVLASQYPIVWESEDDAGALHVGELGLQYIDGDAVRGTHVEGPFKVAGGRRQSQSS